LKDKIVPLLPDVPSGYYEYLHEKPMLKILSSSFHHLEEMQVDPPVYAYCFPAGFTEGAGEEQMESCLFCIAIAEDTSVVVSFYIEVSPPE